MALHPLETAIRLAADLHKFHTDWQGEPYILHPLRVMLAVRADGGTQDEQIAAVLHDVIEDTPYPLEDIRLQYGDEVARLVRALSRYPGGDLYVPDDNGVRETEEESYPDFIQRVIKNGPRAMLIKEADIRDNLSRMEGMRAKNPAKAARLEAKYRDALDALSVARG